MKGIKNIQYQSGVGQIFRLEVITGKYAGIHEIQEPDGFDALDISIDVNEEYYNIDNFILGETSKIKILEYNDKRTFDIIKGVYDEQGGDGQIIFRWYVVHNGVEKDILGEGFEINLNKYQLNYENSQRVIECEIKKREAQNKFYTREDTTINLFAKKNLDENQIEPIGSREIVLKAEEEEIKTEWWMDDYGENYDWYNYKKNIGNKNLDPWFQYQKTVSNIKFIPPKTWVFPKFNRSEDSKLGENIPLYGGDWKASITREELQDPAWAAQYPRYMYEHGEITYWGQNTLFHTRNELSNVVFSISNLHFKARSYSLKKGYNPLYNEDNKGYRENYKPFSFSIALLIETPHGSNTIFLKSSIDTDIGNYSEMNIVNEGWAIGDLPANSIVKIGIMPHNDIRNKEFIITGKVSHTSLKISSSIDKLGRKSRVVSLFDAIDKVAENYSDGQIRLASNILSDGGKYANQYVATGAFLRGVANIFLGENKINTSFKSLFYEGASPLLALGFDVIENQLIVEDIDYFFKDVQAYDLTSKDFVQENLTIENDKDISYNNLIFGTKKYSTKKKGDIFNFNTKMECSTPIKSVKKKLDKTTGFIIDEYKIQDLLDDTNDNTNDNDDDLVLIDTITGSYIDSGSFPDVVHSDAGGVLTLTASKSPWDTLPFKVGDKIKIVEGLNVGEYTILAIKSHTLTLDKRIGIEQGTILTKIEHTLTDVIKNRNATATDGFISAEGVKNKRTAVNLYHNPKYHMKRWFPLFGGGLSKKPNGENIIVTNYKNNGKIEVEPDTDKIPYLPSEVDVLNENINLERLRKSSRVLFGTENIEITLTNVTFEEFYNLYNRWRIGEDIYTGEKIPSRGYIDVYISGETYSIYPFGTEALQYDKGANELTIKGKIKNSKWGRKIFDKTFDQTFE
jgi:hypothetical protein|nr:MAG TPA: hypothetical protein [Caudoviricetes sp.]